MACLRQSKMDKPLFRQGYVKLLRCIYIVQESNCGISVEPENPQAISEGLLKLINLPISEREKLGNNGFNYVLNYHDYSKLARQFIELIQ